MSSPQTLQDLLKDRKWDLIRDQFDGWTLSDIRKFPEYELLELVEPPLRLRTALFIRTYLAPYLRDAEDPLSSQIEALPPAEVVSNCLNLRSKVRSIRFANFALSGMPVEQLAQWSESISREAITGIDLSENNLFEEDLPLVVDFLKQFPHCRMLNLSGNRIYKNHDELIARLLERKIIVVLTGNPIATVDRKDFFRALEQDRPHLLEFLIWIPEQWLAVGNWKVLIGTEEAQALVVKAHQDYYQS